MTLSCTDSKIAGIYLGDEDEVVVKGNTSQDPGTRCRAVIGASLSSVYCHMPGDMQYGDAGIPRGLFVSCHHRDCHGRGQIHLCEGEMSATSPKRWIGAGFLHQATSNRFARNVIAPQDTPCGSYRNLCITRRRQTFAREGSL
jgi:hypothetical protein